MSGSGATCFALFSDPEKRDDAAMQMAKNHPSWWQLSGKLR
jgi:4-diphosphocytidyl-2-C-methyl-D-erythritol kinase